MEEQARIDTSHSGKETVLMTKDVLAQYEDMLLEIKELEQRIVRLRSEVRKIEQEGEVTDMVSGGYGGIQHFTIQGFPEPEHNRKKSILRNREIALVQLKLQVEEQINEIQLYINSIDDSHTRRILSMRYIDGLPWKQVAQNIGGGNTDDAVRKAADRFLEQKN